MPRRILFPVLIWLLSTTALADTANLRIPLRSALYEDLEHFHALGLWSGPGASGPLSRREVLAALEQISSDWRSITAADKKRLARMKTLLGDYAPPVSGGDGHLPTLIRIKPAVHLLGGVASIDSLAGIDRRLRREHAFSLGLDCAIGEHLTAQWRFVGDYSRLTYQPNDEGWFDNLPPTAGEITQNVSSRNDLAVLAFSLPWLDLRLGREERRMGVGRRGSLFLSQNPFPLDGLSIAFRTRYLNGSSLIAQTRRGKNPPSLTPGEPYDWSADEAGDGWIAAHRFELRPPGPLSIGIYEAAAWGGRGLDLGYANPIGFLVAISQDIWDRAGTDDKKLIGLDFSLQLPPVDLYGEFLLDRLVALDAAAGGDSAQISSFGQLIGLRWANPLGLVGADLDLEYAHLDPQVYFHHDGDIRRAFLTEDRLGDRISGWPGEGRLIGHWLGPNADGLYAALSLPPVLWGGSLRLSLESCRWGLTDSPDGPLRGLDAGFHGLTKGEKRWITGAVAAERVLAVSWSRRGFTRVMGGRLDLALTAARVDRSGAWSGGGWQSGLRLDWRGRRDFSF